MTLSTDDEEVKRLYQRELDYNKAVESIRVYFYNEVNDIEDEWRLANPANELPKILQKKDTLLYKYQVLEAFEKSLPVKIDSLIVSVLDSALCIAMGILLNAPSQDGLTGIIGAVMLLFYYAGSVTSSVNYFVSVFRAMDETSIMRAYERIRKDSTAADSSSS